jgi:hypothetical protein
MNDSIEFADLVSRHGEISAWHFLAEIEKAAGIRPRHYIADPEARLAHACLLQDQRRISALDAKREWIAA